MKKLLAVFVVLCMIAFAGAAFGAGYPDTPTIETPATTDYPAPTTPTTPDTPSGGGAAPVSPDYTSTPDGGGAITPDDDSAELPIGIIEPVEELTAEQRQRIVDAVDAITDPSQIRLLTSADLGAPREPTQAMRDEVKAAEYEFVSKLDTVTVSEDGYYAFKINLPPELVGIDVKDLKFYIARQSEFSGNASVVSKGSKLVTAGLLEAGLAFFGDGNLLPIDKTTSTFFALLSLSAGEPLTLYLIRILLLLMGACNAGLAAGTVGLLAAGGFVALRYFRRK